MIVLRLAEANATTLRRIGDRFGLEVSVESGTLTENARGIGYSVASGWDLKLFRQSGGWQYRHATRWQADDGKSNMRIGDEQLAELAFDGLRRYALPVEPAVELLRVQRLHVARCQQDGKDHEERIVGARNHLPPDVLMASRLRALAAERPSMWTTNAN